MLLKLYFSTETVELELDCINIHHALNEMFRNSYNNFIVIDNKCYNLKAVIKFEEVDNENKKTNTKKTSKKTT